MTVYRCRKCEGIVLLVMHPSDFSQQELEEKYAAHELREHTDDMTDVFL